MKIKIDQIYGLIDDVINIRPDEEVEDLEFDKIGDGSLRVKLINTGEVFDISKEGKTTTNAT